MTEILLRELSNADLDWMVTAGEQQTLAPGDRLATGTQLYCVLDGALEQAPPALHQSSAHQSSAHQSESPSAHGKVAGEGIYLQFSSGDLLGSEVLLGQSPSSDIRAKSAATLLMLPQKAIASKLQQDPGFRARFYRVVATMLSERLRQIYEQSAALHRSHQRQLQEALSVLGELRDSDIDWLTVAGRVRTLAPGEFLLQAGRPVDALYLVLEGTFSVLWLDGDVNPLKVCFNCPIETAGQMQQITTLSKGEMAGTSAFLDARPLSVSIRAQEEAVVLCLPRQVVTARLLQDLGFSARFHRVLAIQLSKLLQDIVELGSPDPAAAPDNGQADLDELDDDELDLDDLQNASQGAARFNWMLQRLGVG
ncbi:MAG: cyclic nucleotide-binding domain-containing protein [Elainellaceae cyanobacterium]